MTLFLSCLACFVAGLFLHPLLDRLATRYILLPVAKALDKGTGELHDAVVKAEEALKK